MALFGKDLGIDLGTVNTLICDGGEIVLHEPTVVAIDVDELKIVEVGQAARCGLGHGGRTRGVGFGELRQVFAAAPGGKGGDNRRRDRAAGNAKGVSGHGHFSFWMVDEGTRPSTRRILGSDA